MEFGGSLVVGGRRFLCTYTVQYSTVQYRNFLKILSDDFAHALTLSPAD